MLKKLLIFFGIIILIFGISSLAVAGTAGNMASTGGPAGPGAFSLKQDRNITVNSGVDVEILFDRDIKANAASGTELTSGEWYMAKLSWLMFNRLEPYVKLGAARLEAKWSEAGEKIKLESNTGFAWALGSKLLIWDFKKPRLKIVADGFYRMADLEGDEGTRGTTKVTVDSSQSEFLIREWQIALLAATEIDIGGDDKEEVLGVTSIIPYAGIKYSDMNGRLRLTDSAGNYNNPGTIEADDNFGVVAGLDLVGPSSVSLNLEGRFIDETAMTVGLSVLF
ncbi:MAG: hypothetical protein PHO42_04835 [Candidatus Omnitrophica bacterium]|nr:hypothetical protein [Candidatus Omnitrophota bacterium]